MAAGRPGEPGAGAETVAGPRYLITRSFLVDDRSTPHVPPTSLSLERAMKKISLRATLVLLLGLFPAGFSSPAHAQSSSELYGGWIITAWESPDVQDDSTARRGLFVFAESGQYSIMYVIGDAREPLGQNPSDADIAAAYNPFVANSGRYSISGDVITYEAFMAKDPAYMSRFSGTGGEGNAQTMSFSIDDGVLTLRFGEGGPMGGATATLRRPGSGE
jgi:hypothetical protein